MELIELRTYLEKLINDNVKEVLNLMDSQESVPLLESKVEDKLYSVLYLVALNIIEIKLKNNILHISLKKNNINQINSLTKQILYENDS